MTCVPVVHEVAAGIAVEYFNEVARARAHGPSVLTRDGRPRPHEHPDSDGRRLPGEPRAARHGWTGQGSDLATDGLRQRGIQEIDGLALTAPISVVSHRIETPIARDASPPSSVRERSVGQDRSSSSSASMRKALRSRHRNCRPLQARPPRSRKRPSQISLAWELGQRSAAPVLLLGGGTSRQAVTKALPALRAASFPVMTTWNGTDRLGSDDPVFVGRPNTWGQRSANILIQQSDLVIALGTRLGLQQTGFNWQQFAPLASVVQVDIDPRELERGIRGSIWVCRRRRRVLAHLADSMLPGGRLVVVLPGRPTPRPAVEAANVTAGYLDPYRFVDDLSDRCAGDDIVVPCSSGGAFTITMRHPLERGRDRRHRQGPGQHGRRPVGSRRGRTRQRTRTAWSRATAASRRTCRSSPRSGGQRPQPVKIFIFANNGYASIRMTQRNYFGGEYLGCDTQTGLGFPDWQALFTAFGLPVHDLGEGWFRTMRRFLRRLFDVSGARRVHRPDRPRADVLPEDRQPRPARRAAAWSPTHCT